MGPQQRQLVEQQLLADLRCYGIERAGTRFDWSFAAFQGIDNCALQASIESYAGLYVHDAADEDDGDCIAVGDVKTLRAGDFTLAYWEWLDGYRLDGYEGPAFKPLKQQPGIPAHVWQQIPSELRPLFAHGRG